MPLPIYYYTTLLIYPQCPVLPRAQPEHQLEPDRIQFAQDCRRTGTNAAGNKTRDASEPKRTHTPPMRALRNGSGCVVGALSRKMKLGMNVKNVGGCADVSLLMIRGVNLLYLGVACLPSSGNVLQLPIHCLENLISCAAPTCATSRRLN